MMFKGHVAADIEVRNGEDALEALSGLSKDALATIMIKITDAKGSAAGLKRNTVVTLAGMVFKEISAMVGDETEDKPPQK